MATLYQLKAVREHDATQYNDGVAYLHCPEGQVIHVTHVLRDGWLLAYYFDAANNRIEGHVSREGNHFVVYQPPVLPFKERMPDNAQQIPAVIESKTTTALTSTSEYHGDHPKPTFRSASTCRDPQAGTPKPAGCEMTSNAPNPSTSHVYMAETEYLKGHDIYTPDFGFLIDPDHPITSSDLLGEGGGDI